MDGGTREKLLMKLMDFLSMLPDKEEPSEGVAHEMSEPKAEGLGELLEGKSEEPEAAVDVAVIEAKPKLKSFRD